LYWEFVKLLQKAGEASNSRWKDKDKTKLDKKCHQSSCCNQWNDVAILRLRREFKIGQIDCPNYYDSDCHWKKVRPPNPFAIPDIKFSAQTDDIKRSDTKNETARRRVNELLFAQTEFRYCYQLKEIVASIYAHRLQMSVISGAIAPPMPPFEAAIQKWSEQQGRCSVCQRFMFLVDAIHWDMNANVWSWIHAKCNANAWATQFDKLELSVTDGWRRKHAARYQRLKSFQQLLNEVLLLERDHSMFNSATHHMLPMLITCITNIAEQAIVQTKYNTPLQNEARKLLSDLAVIDTCASTDAEHKASSDQVIPRPEKRQPAAFEAPGPRKKTRSK
jgi:hypothetical protein